MRSIDVASIHRQSLRWLAQELITLKECRNVVVTHHAPSEKSVPNEYIGRIESSAYASNLESIIREYTPSLWLHGHMHNSSSYNIEGCRVICNPRGYPDERNHEFNPEMIVNL